MASIKKKIKKLTLYSSILVLLGSSFNIVTSRKKSKDYKEKIERYVNNFSNDQYLIAAHRGLLDRSIENTEKSVKAADRKDYIDYIEIDVRLTDDNCFVISHDDSLTNTYFDQIKISESSKEEIINSKYRYFPRCCNEEVTFLKDNLKKKIAFNKKIEFIGKKYKISTLEEVLKKGNDKKLILDLKFKNNTKEYIKELNNIIKPSMLDNIIFESTSTASLLCLKHEHPEYFCSLIVNSPKDINYMDYFDSCSIRKDLMNDSSLKDKLSNKDKVLVWNINSISDINNIVKNYQKDYKDFIYMTDNPDLVAYKLKQKEKKFKHN